MTTSAGSDRSGAAGLEFAALSCCAAVDADRTNLPPGRRRLPARCGGVPRPDQIIGWVTPRRCCGRRIRGCFRTARSTTVRPRHQRKRAVRPGAVVPLVDILNALPPGLPLSVEWWQEPCYSAAEWAAHALAGMRAFLAQYYAADRAAERARSNNPTTSS